VFFLLFCMGLQKALLNLQRECPEILFQCWYADGGQICVLEEHAAKVLRVLKKELEAMTLKLGWAKCISSGPLPLTDEDIAYLGGSPRVAGLDDVVKSNGIPVHFTERSLRLWLVTLLAKSSKLIDGIEELDDVHRGYAMLRNTVAFCKVVHLMRSVPAEDESLLFFFLEEFDRTVYDGFDRICRLSTSTFERHQLGLPSSRGGFGLRSSSFHAEAAYISASIQCQERIRILVNDANYVNPALPAAIERYNEKLGLFIPHSALQAPALLTAQDLTQPGTDQEKLSERLDTVTSSLLLSSCESQEDTVRILGLQLPKSMESLNVLPNPSMRLQLDNRHCTTWFKFLLGSFEEHEGQTCQALGCGKQLDRLGVHAATCGTGHARKSKHDRLVDIAADFAKSGDFTVHKDRAVLRDRHNAPRPADFLIGRFRKGQDAAFDITIRAPQQSKYLKGSLKDKAHALKQAEAEKRRKYDEMCKNQDILFIPLAATIYGGWSQYALENMNEIVKSVADELRLRRSVAASRLFGPLSISLARSTAQMILDRRPPLPIPRFD
jgi:hypothetical protein